MVTGTDKFSAGSKYAERHLKYNDYLDKHRTIEGQWWGKGCQRYGVDAGSPVHDAEFESLRDNRHVQTGRKITFEKEGRKPFCDMNTGAPKTFSIGAVVGKSEALRECHRRAALKALEEMERLTGRQAHNRRDHVEVTGNACVGVWEHDTNRSLEAHLHTHQIFLNMTRAANGKDYAIEFREFLDRHRYLTMVYNDELATQALNLGVELVQDQYGAPQIKALLDLKEKSEQRTKDIEALVEKVEEIAGTCLTNREAKKIALACRGLDVSAFEVRWEQIKPELAGLKSLDPEKAEANRFQILDRFTKEVWAAVNESGNAGLIKITAQEVEARQRATYTAEELNRIHDLAQSLAPVQRQDQSRQIREELTHCIDHLFERRSVVKDHELYAEVLLRAQGKRVDLGAMKAAVVNHPELVCVRGEVTTVEHLRRELESILWVEEGRGRGVSLPADGLSEKLNPSQRAAIQSLLESRDQFTALSGAAGVGKTHSVCELIRKNLEAGYRVMCVAPSDEARNRLREEAEKLPAGSAGAAVLEQAASLQLFMANPRLRNGLGPNDLLIVDEASMASVKQGHEVQRWARRSGCRVLFMGDVDQNVSVEAGDHFRVLLKASPLHTAPLAEIIRQKPESLDGHYLQAVKRFKAGKTTEAFSELHQAGRIRELHGQDRVEAFAEAIVRSEEEGRPAIATCATHRENDAIGEAVRRRWHKQGKLTEERTLTVHRSLGWTQAQKREVNKIQPGQVLEIVKGPDKGRYWTVTGVERGKVMAVDAKGERRLFGRQHAGLFDVCEQRQINLAIGDRVLMRAGVRDKRGNFINGERLTVAGWDAAGNPVASDGRSITGRDLSYAYAATTHACEGATGLKVITGFDRHSVRSATQKIAYVACSRGREDIEVFVESVADLSRIQNRTGDRKAAVEMAFEPDQNDRRAEVKRLFRHLQRVRAAKGTVERARTVDLCRQAAEALEPGRDQKHAADLQKGAIRTAQQAARRAEVHAWHEDLDEDRKHQQGRSRGRGMGR
jgi:conjugative relaxase-like TrwC/TraI family protein